MTQAQRALAAIKSYLASAPSEDAHAHGRHIWEAIIQGAEGYDEEAVFADGSRLWWNAALNAWETGPASDQMRMA